MSVWDSLIGMIGTALKDKPRHDVLYALLDLRAAMSACHKTYFDLQELAERGNYADEMAERRKLQPPEPGLQVYDPYDSWMESVTRLAMALAQANPTLRVMSPEASQRIAEYLQGEVSITPDGEFTQSMRFLKRYDAEIDLDRRVFKSKFKRALENLDTFIRTSFKPEEVFEANKSIREWPYPFVFVGEYWLKY
jgi:hypothetical protein